MQMSSLSFPYLKLARNSISVKHLFLSSVWLEMAMKRIGQKVYSVYLGKPYVKFFWRFPILLELFFLFFPHLFNKTGWQVSQHTALKSVVSCAGNRVCVCGDVCCLCVERDKNLTSSSDSSDVLVPGWVFLALTVLFLNTGNRRRRLPTGSATVHV